MFKQVYCAHRSINCEAHAVLFCEIIHEVSTCRFVWHDLQALGKADAQGLASRMAFWLQHQKYPSLCSVWSNQPSSPKPPRRPVLSRTNSHQLLSKTACPHPSAAGTRGLLQFFQRRVKDSGAPRLDRTQTLSKCSISSGWPCVRPKFQFQARCAKPDFTQKEKHISSQ